MEPSVAAPIEAAPLAAGEPRKWLTVVVVAAGALMTTLDATVVNVALPVIRSDFGYLDVSVSDLQWVVNAYTLTYAALLLIAGKLGDLFGRRRIFLIGVVVFTAASIGCGAAGNIDILIALRALQGVGAALITPCSLSIVTATFAAEERGLAMGLWSGVLGVGVALGPLVGGTLVDQINWRWVFFINIPVGAACIAGALAWVAESRDPQQERKLDLAGVVLSAVPLFALTFGLLQGNDYGWTDGRTVGALIVGVIGLVAFVLVERSRDLPMLPLQLFRSATFAGANLIAVFAGFILFGQLFLGSLVLQTVMSYSALETGAALLPMTLLIMVVSPVVGVLMNKGVGPRWLVASGMILLADSLVLWSRVGFGSDFYDILPALVLGGAGFGLVLTALTTAGLAGVPVRHAGIGSGIMNTTRQAGGAIGLAVMVTISTTVIDSWLIDGRTRADGFVRGFEIAMLAGAGVTLCGALIAALTLTRQASVAEPARAPAQLELRPTASWAVAAPSAVRPLLRVVPAAPVGFEFEVVAGPATGMRVKDPPLPLLLGRAAAAPGDLNGDPELSRNHARLSRRPDGLILLEDLASTNGTQLNGAPVGEPVAVSEGDSIRLGISELRVVKAPVAGQPAPAAAASPRLDLDMTRMSMRSPSRTAIGGLVLLVEAGRSAGESIPVREELIIGRAEPDSGRLGGDPEISRRHASLSEFDPGRVLVEDLASTNGTFVNGHRIYAPTLVTPGDQVRMGTTTLRLLATASGAPGESRGEPVASGGGA